MAEFPALPLFTDAYLGDTTHLTTTEHGAYLLLLITMWRTKETRLPDDDRLLARYAKLTSTQWKRMRPIIAPFFNIKDGFWTQGRLTDEAAAVRQLSKRQSDKVKGRWLKEKEKSIPQYNRGNTSPTPPIIIESISKDIASIHRPKVSFSGDDFKAFFEAYPKPTAMGAARTSFANAVMMRAADPKQIINAAKNFKAKTDKEPPEEKRYIPNPSKWLDADCYLDPDLQGTIEPKASVEDFTGWQKTIAKSMGIHIVKSWFTNCEYDESSGTMIAPSKFVYDHIRQQYGQKLRDILGVKNISLKDA